jgi:hypothetical protein
MYIFTVTLTTVYVNSKMVNENTVKKLVRYRTCGGLYGHGKLGAGGSGQCPAAGG